MSVAERPMFWLIIGYVTLYWVAASAFPPWYVIEVYDALTVSFGLAVMVMYGPEWLRGLLSKVPDQGDYLILGIGVTWASAMLDRGWRLIWRVTGRPDWMIDHPFLGFLLSLMVLGGIMHLVARFDERGRVAVSSQRFVVYATLFGLVTAAVALALTPPRFQ